MLRCAARCRASAAAATHAAAATGRTVMLGSSAAAAAAAVVPALAACSALAYRRSVFPLPALSSPRSLVRCFSVASAAPAAAGAKSAAAAYSATMLLPRTTYEQHPKAIAERERELSARFCGDPLYRWQNDRAASSAAPVPQFLLHDGPPFANGRLHMGHFLNKVLKDFINRYQLMRGKHIRYTPGWDCHGLPIEVKALEQLRTQRPDVDPRDMSAAEVRQIAAQFAAAASEEQRANFRRWGILGDWDRPYSTMAPAYEASQLGVFAKLVGRGLIQRGLKPVYWSPVSCTALAEAELEYVDNHASISLHVKFALEQLGEAAQTAGLSLERFPKLQALIWTTTPWTLPSNLAIAFHPELQYAVVRVGAKNQTEAATAASTPPVKGPPKPKDITEEGENMEGSLLLIGVDRVAAIESLLQRPLSVLHTVSGSALSGSHAHHPFLPRAVPFIPGSHVTTDGGTSLVHTAPGHGMEDFSACKAAGINEVLCPVDAEGNYTADVGVAELMGHNVLKGASKTVVSILRANGQLVHSTRLVHRFPYDWRSKTPVIQRATEQWFCRLDSIQDVALRALESVQMVPASGRARLEGMIGSRKEWCISRQRAWGVPIPVFYHSSTGAPLLTVESVEHVAQLVEQHGTDCWWTMPIADLLPPSHRADAASYTRGTDTMDVWFDSGCSWKAVVQDQLGLGPQAQADMYLEGSDQHRGWFQSALLTSVAATDRAPYKTILTHGFVLDEEFRKMSKSLGNVVDPNTIIDGKDEATADGAGAKDTGQQATATAVAAGAGSGKKAKVRKHPAPSSSSAALGVDLLRLWVSSSDYSGDVSIGKSVLSKMSEAMKKLRHSAKFMLGVLDDFAPADMVPAAQLSNIDQYVLHTMQQYAHDVTEAYDAYAFKDVFSLLLQFNSQTLSAFVFDLSKDRFYAEAPSSLSRRAAQTVLLHALVTFTKSAAPILPHFAEDVYQHVPAQLKPLFRHNAAHHAHTEATNADALDSVFVHGWLSPLAPQASAAAPPSPVSASASVSASSFAAPPCPSLSSPATASVISAVSSARRVRSHVTKLLERMRQEKRIANFTEAAVCVSLPADSLLYRELASLGADLSVVWMTGSTELRASLDSAASAAVGATAPPSASASSSVLRASEVDSAGVDTPMEIRFALMAGHKCPRCWLFSADISDTQTCCNRCNAVMQQRHSTAADAL